LGVLVCLGGSAALAGAEAGPAGAPRGSAAAPPADQAAVAGAVHGAGIPPPPNANSDYGIHFNPITTRVPKAKVAFNLPPVIFRSYLQVCIATTGFQTPCPGHKLSIYPKLPFPYTWDAAFANNWVAVRKHGHLTYGKFPPVRVSMLAFGSIPVTATAHLTQTAHNGFYDPMKLQLTLDITEVPPGRHVPGFGPAPKFPQGTTFFAYQALATGTVNIRLSNVVVDQIPLRVGPSCRTSSPAALQLTAPAGYYPQNVPPQKLKGKPGEFQPLAGGGPGGYLQGSVNVPTFTGCHNGADILNPLITGMISGNDNPVHAYSPAGLQSWCTEQIAHCTSATTAAQRLVLGAHSATSLHRALATPAGRLAVTGAGSYRPPPAD
jgi:hypothetical protein